MMKWIRIASMSAIMMTALMAKESYACSSGLEIRLQTSTINLNSDNFPNLRVRVRRSPSNVTCSYFVTVENGGASSYLTRVLNSGTYEYPVQFYKDAGQTQIIRSYAEASSSADVLAGSYPSSGGGRNSDVYYRPFLEPDTYKRFGSYSKVFTLRLYKGTVGGSHSLEDTANITLNYTQSKQIDLSLVNTGAPFNTADISQTLNFGALTSGASMSFDLVLGYNAGYRISMSSINAGKIKRTGGSNLIPYTLQLSGNAVTLNTSPTIVATATGVSPVGGRRLPVTVTIGSLGAATPGTYTDTVTFTVASSE